MNFVSVKDKFVKIFIRNRGKVIPILFHFCIAIIYKILYVYFFFFFFMYILSF